MISIQDGEIPNSLAKNRMRASFALPSIGGAVTFTLIPSLKGLTTSFFGDLGWR
jgi:hypothetical protein